ncbi:MULTISPECIES: hypothetical protein [Herbaspirillum]|uniref:Uncharacterized protein n=2 Tax=Herbaspirillum huttiense TaxID=863372 RepID=A0AAJ2HCA4_9BURK|nr:MULTISPECIES: hypothetical protein [Herbaspirillum]MDR9836893.1 hypothetical protein [Herbaspirillum huttiense]
MTAKTSGAEFKQFYNDKAFWPEDAWHEDSVILVDGKPHEDLSDNQIADSAKVVIDSGHVFFSREDSAGVSMATFFNRWRKVQNMRTLAVEVPLDKMEAVIAAIKAAGGKIK